MVVLEKGRDVSFEVEKLCSDCKTIFVIESVDTRKDAGGHYTWCPNCKFVVRITDEEHNTMLKKYGHSEKL